MKIGYSRPRATRGLHPSGLREVMVWRAKDLLGIDPKLQVARIAHTVGENKRVQIIDEAKKANIRILNPGLKKPAEALPEVPAEPTVGEPTPTEPTPETKEGTAEVKNEGNRTSQTETKEKSQAKNRNKKEE